ncbi:MAG: HEAT repeat domain-containing protein [Pirellulaceae bacterium]
MGKEGNQIAAVPGLVLLLCAASMALAESASLHHRLAPYEQQVAEQMGRLDSAEAKRRAGAAEALGYLRAYSAEQALVERLDDPSAQVRREAAMALAWCGSRRSVATLLRSLDDSDWSTRQAAHVALTNLTGMEFPFDSTAPARRRKAQAGMWRHWWSEVPPDGIPGTVLELLAPSKTSAPNEFPGPIEWRHERGLRALGALGGVGATETIRDHLGTEPRTEPEWRPAVRAGIRALGRLREEAGLKRLVALLDNTMWARCAADALGDFGDRRAVSPLLAAYPRYAKQMDGRFPPEVPDDDNWGAPPTDVGEDRMLETPFAISYALCRLPLDDPADRQALRRLAPLILANLPRDHDRFMLYELAVPGRLTRYLMEQSGLRQEACEHAFERLGQMRRVPKPLDAPVWPEPPEYAGIDPAQRRVICISTWLPNLCTDEEDLPRLVALLEHKEGWVRINAAKTLALLGKRQAAEPIATLLANAKPEADFGYCGTFKFDEYNDPAPRWREAFVRALGILGAHEHSMRIVQILDDERSTLGVRYAAAQALADLLAHGSNPRAQAALAKAASDHPFQTIRQLARDTLRIRGLPLNDLSRFRELARRGSPTPPKRPTVRSPGITQGGLEQPEPASPVSPQLPTTGQPETTASPFQALLFIKGDNRMPNDVGTVELADRWRRTYVYTDPGPVYRPGRNLFVLRPPQPDGRVSPLTHFPNGYVADAEVSWDGTEVIFSRRGELDPWWHVWRINTDGTGLQQVTGGPHHDVGPAYLPDDRIVFSSTRSGIRDEYHGYQCNALYVMNADGSGIERIATNAGRDNEPTVLLDGRIAFCRLEMFYARIKTELTLHAVHADGTQDVVLYGPERRAFWHELNYGARSRIGNVENPLTFGVLRMTQPQPMPDGRRIVVATQGGLALVGGLRDREEIVTPENETRVYTTPFPLPDGRILCASTPKEFDREKIDLALYQLDPATKKFHLIYNDPATADFEPRPILPRRRPVVQPIKTRRGAYSGRMMCASVFTTQEKEVRRRGRLVRLIEGMPAVGRHSTHTNLWPVWKNHHGLFARVLGTVPLAPDGSFCVEVPADRLLHFQVLDSNRRVIGNQLTWIYARAGETKSCAGCHENPHTAPVNDRPTAARNPPISLLPAGDEFTYRAKAWMKGYLPPEVEERMRTVRAVNLMGR